VIRVAEASGVNLPEPTAREALEKGRAFPPEAKTSFQRDFERRERKDERDLFAGSILRMARRLNIAVPGIEGLSAKLNEMKPLVPD
jgi:2-dehydropantoate 2-reductase